MIFNGYFGSKPNKSWKVDAHLQQTSCLSGSWGRGSLGGREFVEISKAYFGVYRKKIKFRKQLNSNLRDRAVYAAAYTFYLGNISFATLIKVQTHTRVCGSNKLTGQCTRNKLTKRLTVTVLNKSNELLKYVSLCKTVLKYFTDVYYLIEVFALCFEFLSTVLTDLFLAPFTGDLRPFAFSRVLTLWFDIVLCK